MVSSPCDSMRVDQSDGGTQNRSTGRPPWAERESFWWQRKRSEYLPESLTVSVSKSGMNISKACRTPSARRDSGHSSEPPSAELAVVITPNPQKMLELRRFPFGHELAQISNEFLLSVSPAPHWPSDVPESPGLFEICYFLGLLSTSRSFYHQIRRRIREGAFRRVARLLAARGFVGMITDHFLIQELFGGERHRKFDSRRVSETLTDIWLHGMMG